MPAWIILAGWGSTAAAASAVFVVAPWFRRRQEIRAAVRRMDAEHEELIRSAR
jgi:hypothetical protein